MEAQEELKKYGDVSKVEWKQCNLEDLNQTDKVAKELSKLDRLDSVSAYEGVQEQYNDMLMNKAYPECWSGCWSLQRDQRRHRFVVGIP